MRGIVIAGVLCAAACGRGDKKAAAGPPPETSTGPGMAGLLACQALVRAMDAFVACAPNADEKVIAEHFQTSQREMVTATKPFADAAAAKASARMCLDFLEALQKDMATKKCAYTPTAQELTWLDAERRRRTPIPAEAKGADRELLASVSALRERACACKTAECVDVVERDLDRGLTPLSKDASAVLRDAASEMLDELMRCGRRVRTDIAMAGPAESDDPAAIRALAEQIRAERAAAKQPPVPPGPPPPPVMLPDGKQLTIGDCAKITGSFEREACEFLFDEVAMCHERGGESAECIDGAIKEYVGWSSEDGDTFDEDEH